MKATGGRREWNTQSDIVPAANAPRIPAATTLSAPCWKMGESRASFCASCIYRGNHCSKPCRTKPVQNSEMAIVTVMGFVNTFFARYLKSALVLSPLEASAVSKSSSPAPRGVSWTNKNVRIPIPAMIPAGMKKTHCQGRRVTAIPPMKKIRNRPLWIIDPNIAEKTPRSRTWNQPEFTLMSARALYDWKYALSPQIVAKYARRTVPVCHRPT